jgi:hypothetical protein
MPLVEKNRGYEFPCEISMDGEKDDTEHVDTICRYFFTVETVEHGHLCRLIEFSWNV